MNTHKSERETWYGMKKRCYNKNFKHYNNYGGRGITICDRWKDSFNNFFIDMGPKPTPQHSIDRINSDGNYEPGNCKWSTRSQQSNNQRNRIFIEHNNMKKTFTEWIRFLNIDLEVKTVCARYKRGWRDFDKLFTCVHKD